MGRILLIVVLSLCISVSTFAQISLELRQSDSGQQLIAHGARAPIVLATTSGELSDLRVHPVVGQPACGVTWTDTREGEAHHYQGITLDGLTFKAVREISYDLQLRFQVFDPMTRIPDVPSFLRAPATSELWIVQYWTQELESYRAALEAGGMTVLAPLRHNASIVRMSSRAASFAATQPFVRSVVAFHPAYKLDEHLLGDQLDGFSRAGVQKVNILAFERGMAAQLAIKAAVEAAGGQVHMIDPDCRIVTAMLGLQQITSVIALDEVQWVDPRGEDSVDMAVARTAHGADFVETAGGYDGSGVRGEVLDSGCRTTHQEFAAHLPIPHGATTVGSHGTSTSGQVFANGVDPSARGMLPEGQLITAYYSGLAGTRHNHTGELVNAALPYKCVFQTNSWGSSQVTTYTTVSAEMDTILFDYPRFVIMQSQSNTGNQTSRPQAWAKNMVAVGGVAHFNTLSEADDSWTSASIGPAQDGRVKPELASWYDSLRTTSFNSDTSYTNTFGGTSGATPIVAGSFGLFFQMWGQGAFGNIPGTTVFDTRPNNTTSRAFMIASATQWDFVSGTAANSDIDRDKQGWGRPDLTQLHNYRNKAYWVDETDVLTNLSSSTHIITVQPGESIFKATLVWREPSGTVNSSQHLINNLDLQVTSPSGTIYNGNFGLTNHVSGAAGENLWSLPGGSPENVNSVENVFVQNPQSGNWLVTVTASNVVQDNHVETAAVDVDYALVVLGGQSSAVPFFDLQLTPVGVGGATIALNNVPAGTVEGYTLFAEQATQPLGGGALLGLYPTVLTLNILTMPPSPGFLLHWTVPTGGGFPDVPVTVPAGTLPTAAFPIDGRGVAIGPGFTLQGVTPIRRLQ